MVLLTLLLSGCGVKFAYNQLDWAIPWYLSDYMSMDGEQEDAFDAQLEQYLSWHRQTQLPLYSEFLNNVADGLEKGMTEDLIAYSRERSNELGNELVKRLAPDMVQFFNSASDKQVAQLYKKFAEDNQEYRDEYIGGSDGDQKKSRVKEIQTYIERWTGGLNDEQVAMVHQSADEYQSMSEELLEAKIAWQDEFKRVLGLRSDPNAYREAMTTLFLSEGFGRSESFHQKLAHNEKVLLALYLKLDASLSKKQRRHTVKTLRGYAQDFYDLAQN